MTRARPFLPLLLATVPLAVAGCQTVRKPLTGFDKPPPGIILDGDGASSLLLWPIFDLPREPQQTFRPRFNGQDAVIVTSEEGFADYAKTYLQGWTGGWSQWINGIPAGTYTVGLVDSTGHSWGESPPVPISASGESWMPAVQWPVVVLANFDGQASSWTVDPTMRDSDATTDEIIVTNLLDEGVIVQRCLIATGSQTSCTPVGTVAPGADLRTVERLAPSSRDDHQALFFQLASDANASYRRDLVEASTIGVTSCQMERIIDHGRRPMPSDNPTGFTPFAMSSCYGYASVGQTGTF